MASTANTLAIFRVEGVLVRRSALGCAAWLAAGQRAWGGRLGRLALVGAAGALGGASAETAHRVAWRALRGCSEDRLAVLAEQYQDELVRGAWNEAGWQLLDRCRDAGDRIVLLSDHPRPCLGVVVERAGEAELICNDLETARGELTGALAAPIVTGAVDGAWLRRAAETRGVDPRAVRAYGAAAEDATMLAAAPRPCAVTPDRVLRTLARQHDWPVVDA